MELGLTYDDVQIIPAFSDVVSRDNVDTSPNIYKMKLPIISSPMMTVTNAKMAIAIHKFGGLGVIHRFQSIEQQVKQVQRTKCPVFAATGVIGDYKERAAALLAAGVEGILLDAANGYTTLMRNAISQLNSNSTVPTIIVGNVATAAGYTYLATLDIKAIRVGIGGGSACSTRIRTGGGIPNVTAIMNCKKAKRELQMKNKNAPLIIADGGIRYSGDVAKAISAGADLVMLGAMLAGTSESPGDKIQRGEFPNEQLFKEYKGSASHGSKYIEGQQFLIPWKGSVERIMKGIDEGLRSAMSYVGAYDLKEFRAKANLIQVTNSGMVEATAHGNI